MASSSRAMSALRPVQFAPRASSISSSPAATTRAFATSSQRTLKFVPTSRPHAPSIARQTTLARQFQRAYADAAPLPPPKKPGKVRTTFKWLWRLTYLSAIGLTVGVGYTIYVDRNPQPQFEADPTKKTLVVLGTGWGSVSLLKKLDTENYNVIVISPRNYFLFTPLLPSCTTGLIEHRSIMEPVRAILQHKKAAVKFYEAEASSIDPERKVVMITDNSEVKGATSQTEIPYDMLVIGVGAENATFGIPGVRENSCFLKEINDAQSIRKKIMDCVETAAFKGQTNEEIDRLLHMVLFWRSAYLSMCFSTRNRLLVIIDWLKSKAFGRDVSRE
ncbi:hypothetical protein BN1723_009725 [Verticillium longisporum]|uniref:NADH:ubiquinone reductase (non-electrogenic) n=2 Tax=Verticillium longisporum TaxID=100787 RepID=A0A0G4KRG3_VERLO|nr:hypothetical protein BN1723_009725 [Verticillium longisporum]